MRVLVQTDVCVSLRNKTGHTALHEAAMKGLNKHIIELYNHGADVKTRDADGGSALHVSTGLDHPTLPKLSLFATQTY